MSIVTLRSLCLMSILLFSLGCGESLQKSIDDGPGVDQPQGSYSYSHIHSSGGWPNQVVMYLNQDVPDRILEATLATFRVWNEAIGRDLLSYGGRIAALPQVSLYNILGDDRTVLYYDQEWAKHTGKSGGVLATTVWENSKTKQSEIVKGDIVLNAENFLFQDSTIDPIDPGRIYDIADTESVLIHETGHLIGLDHVAEDEDFDSVMHAKTFVGLDIYSRILSEGDVERIRSIYDR